VRNGNGYFGDREPQQLDALALSEAQCFCDALYKCRREVAVTAAPFEGGVPVRGHTNQFSNLFAA
jgi:hypothetical protein